MGSTRRAAAKALMSGGVVGSAEVAVSCVIGVSGDVGSGSMEPEAGFVAAGTVVRMASERRPLSGRAEDVGGGADGGTCGRRGGSRRRLSALSISSVLSVSGKGGRRAIRGWGEGGEIVAGASATFGVVGAEAVSRIVGAGEGAGSGKISSSMTPSAVSGSRSAVALDFGLRSMSWDKTIMTSRPAPWVRNDRPHGPPRRHMPLT